MLRQQFDNSIKNLCVLDFYNPIVRLTPAFSSTYFAAMSV